jgi:hypothetical protein
MAPRYFHDTRDGPFPKNFSITREFLQMEMQKAIDEVTKDPISLIKYLSQEST